MSFKIYLAGSIPKGDNIRKGWTDWKVAYKEALSSIESVDFLDADDMKDESDPLMVFGHDSNMVKNADLIIVNAEKKIGKGIGAGTAQEMVIAKYFSHPVVTVLPKDTHHRRSNIIFHGEEIDDWIHPFIHTFSDLVVEKIDDCLDWVKKFMDDPATIEVKDIKVIDQGIESFLKSRDG
jgi:hypothetical protein